MDSSPLEYEEELPENYPTGGVMEGQISKQQQKAWEWSSVEAGGFVFRKPFLEAGKWHCRRIEKATGKAKRITLDDASSLREARKEVSKLAKNEIPPAPADSERINLNDAMDKWLLTFEVRNVSLRSYKSMGNRVKIFLNPQKFIDEIKYQDIEDLFFIHWKSKKSKTKQMYRIFLAKFFDWCVKRGYCRDNHASKIVVPKKWIMEIRESSLNTGQALLFEEARKLLSACMDRKEIRFPVKDSSLNRNRKEDIDYLFMFVLISLRTGLRKSNIVKTKFKPGLRWRDIDLKEGVIKIDKEFMKNGIEFKVPIHAELLFELRKKLSMMGRVPSPDENIVKIKIFKKAFRAALKTAGLKDRHFRIHDLRHTFASWLGEFCPHAVMQKLLSHTPTSITDKYAHHQNMEVLREWLNKLPWLASEVSEQHEEAFGSL